MESDQEDQKFVTSNKLDSKEKSISHEDLSDVSDLDSADENSSKVNKISLYKTFTK